MRLSVLYEDGPKPWVNPDQVWGGRRSGAMPFIYTDDGVMYYGFRGETHRGMIVDEPELRERYFDILYQIESVRRSPLTEDEPSWADSDFGAGISSDSSDWRDWIETFDLLGRVSTSRDLVSFWNSDSALLDKLLKPCCQMLLDDGHLKNSGAVSTPVHGTVPLRDVVGGGQLALQPFSPEDIALYKRLHTMRGQEKLAARKKLGLYNPTPPEKPWPAALRKAGFVGPGQKWWAPYSEGVVAQARGTVLSVINDLASRLANVAEHTFGRDGHLGLLLTRRRPNVVFADQEDEPATITLLFGRPGTPSGPQALTLQVYGDGAGEIKVEMAQKLALLLNLPRRLVVNSEEEAVTKLGQIAGTMAERLRRNLRI